MMALKPKRMAFDILDDNLGFPGIRPDEKAVLEDRFRELVNKANVVTAVSPYLVEKFSAKFQNDIHLLPNGLDVERFSYRPEYARPIAELNGLERPVIGFIGALTSWIDFELILKMAEHIKTGSIALVGPIYSTAVSQLKGHPRIRFIDSIPYERVPHFLYQFDILLLPRNYEPHSLASDPLKLYEYMATGKPVLSTALPSAMRFQDVIYVGKTHQDILDLLGKIPAHWSSEQSLAEIQRVASMDWHQRAERLLRWIED
ncbi:glycosyl transferase, group 2 family protein, putative [Heliomicrobium modesticaldum Ice1]|uniref:Glycosyl transferase, group 2 family protein, putative n=2 Tax=Heliomicrobium modesticaldum TaxID=35701 RepID=B0TAT6_HELMI|nr:glycosyl transferase, group 2 family protein, putative [Heliomicrobium modesticaldum Ice1]